MYVSDHRPALLGAASAIVMTGTHYLTPAELHPHLEALKFYLSILGQLAGVVAGFGSGGWYLYSYLRARKGKKSDDIG